jgi:hypothetical protein
MDLQLYGSSTLEAGFLTGIKYYALMDKDKGNITIMIIIYTTDFKKPWGPLGRQKIHPMV